MYFQYPIIPPYGLNIHLTDRLANYQIPIPLLVLYLLHFFFQAEDGIRDRNVTGVQTCALPISKGKIPAYLGSSFAFISPVTVVLGHYAGGEGYSYALGGFFAVGATLVIISLIVKVAGTAWIDVVFPPAAMGAIVAVIGLELVPTAADMAGLIRPDDAGDN